MSLRNSGGGNCVTTTLLLIQIGVNSWLTFSWRNCTCYQSKRLHAYYNSTADPIILLLFRSFVNNASIFHHTGNREIYCIHLIFNFWCHYNNISSSILMNSSKLEKQDNVFWNPGWLGRQHPWNSAARFFVAFHSWIVFILVHVRVSVFLWHMRIAREDFFG